MARIRTIKPEAFQSETLAEVSLAAERTFFGLSTQVDDRGRIADKPAVINGALWAVRSEQSPHTAADLDAELGVLEKAGALCRYVGCDGKRYLHFVTWDEHQKVDKASKSRVPRCPHHRSDRPERDYCGRHGTDECPPLPSPVVEPSRESREGSREPREVSRASQRSSEDVGEPSGPREERPDAADKAASARSSEDDSDQRECRTSRGSREPSRDSREDSAVDLGPRTVDLGPRTVPPSAGAVAPRAEATPLTPPETADQLIADWLDHIPKRPPGQVIGQVGKHVKTMLDERIEPADIRAGIARWAAKGLNPSTLPSVVNEVMNAGPLLNGAAPGAGRAQSTTDQRVAAAFDLARQLAAEHPTNGHHPEGIIR